jgi:cytochrome c oxidase assembly protein subunit 11
MRAGIQASAGLAAANRRLFAKLLVIALGMFGFGFALVPFYETICEVTGIRNAFRPDAVSPQNTQVDASRYVAVEFDSSVTTSETPSPWTFKPLEGSVSVHPGAVTQVVYELRNTLDRPVTGQAVPSYAPQYAAGYFKKLECFCFTQQTLGPGEVRRMPVVFVIDPSVPGDVNAITLSYTFFEVAGTRAKGG